MLDVYLNYYMYSFYTYSLIYSLTQ